MSKYTVVGIFNLLSGLLTGFYSLTTIFITVPKMMKLYDQFNTEEVSLTPAYLGFGFLFLFAIANLYISWKLFSKVNNKKEKHLKIGAFLLVISFLSFGIFAYITTLSVIAPIYDVTTTL